MTELPVRHGPHELLSPHLRLPFEGVVIFFMASFE